MTDDDVFLGTDGRRWRFTGETELDPATEFYVPVITPVDDDPDD